MGKINIAEIIKSYPKGMELDCTICEDVYFDYVSEFNIIHCYIQYETYRTSITFNQYGAINSDIKAKCVIFPKGKTTWEGFVPPCQFKDGDIVFYDNCVSIFKEWGDETLFRNYVKVDIGERYPMLCDRTHSNGKGIKREARFATKEEKAKLFKSIRDNGYKWNPKTKTLENLFSYNIGKKVWVKSDKEHKYVHTIVGISRNSFGNLEYEVKEEKSGVVVHYPESLLIPITTKELKFKVGDRIRHKCPEFRGERIVNICCDTGYFTTINDWIDIAHQDDWELVSNIEPNFKVGDTITNGKISITIGYIDDKYYYEIGRNIAHRLFIENQDEWNLVPDKFDITTLVPFESRVLVRNDKISCWKPAIFGCCVEDTIPYYVLGGTCWKYCIPYEGNEYLRGKTDDCKECFKTWK